MQKSAGMPIFIRAFIRLSFGVLGCLLSMAGIAALIAGVGGHIQTLVLHGLLYSIVGCCIAYWAFGRAPWESRPTTERQDSYGDGKE